MLDRIITYSFYWLFFFTPLFWTSVNYELFEYNKMTLTYGLTVVIVGAWILKSINDKRLTIKHTPLDIPLLLFLGANILSTIFSIDTHTSIWGYYSRLNGGLLSIVSYLLLYFAFVSNFNKEKVINLLKIGLLSGLLISIYAILEHFGVSISCVILRGEFNASCWVQDVQARVFATLGQPNWLAAYLTMLIFPALYFLLTEKKKLLYYLLLFAYYLAFTFTYSRGPTLGLIVGLLVFIGLHILSLHPKGGKLNLANIKPILIVLIGFISINILFGSALTSFRLVSKFAAPSRPTISLPVQVGTQLETGGTESGQIRFIVWIGALDIFKNYPIFGSGLETFAYAYYQFRPISHNLTSEWDFLYNKAHNEYLNYLSTTGIVGFGTYLLVIIWFIAYCLLFIVKHKPYTINHLLLSSLLASYISYLIYNFFLFSVVIIALFFYLFPALVFVATDVTKPLKPPSFLHPIFYILQTIYRRPLYTKISQVIIVLFTIYLLFSILLRWHADTLFANGQRAQDRGNPGRAYNYLLEASALNKGEPFYRSELAFSAASLASVLKDEEATLAAQLKDEAEIEITHVLKNSPNNVSFLRTAVRVYFELSSIDRKYIDETLKVLEKAISLAPTDPKLYLNKALILESVDKKEESIKALQKALELKPNYLEAKAALEEATASANQ